MAGSKGKKCTLPANKKVPTRPHDSRRRSDAADSHATGYTVLIGR